MRFGLLVFIIGMAMSSVCADFEVNQADPGEIHGEQRFRFMESLDNDLDWPHDSDDEQRRSCIFINLKNVFNVDHLSNVFNIQFELNEHWRNVNLSGLPNETGSRILVPESNMTYIDTLYPNLVIEERDYNDYNAFEGPAGHPISHSKFRRPNAFRQYFYLPAKSVLIKSFKFNLQVRCVISMQNYPFIESPCKISLRAGNPERNFNYSICNLSAFINRKFTFKKFKAEVTSLNKLCDDLNEIERIYLKSTSCFQLLITIESSKRFFFVHFLLTFLLLVISYLSLWVPIYNHTSRVAMLTLPIIGSHLFDQALLNNDRILFRESTSLHIWRLACLLYIGFMFFCYVLAFYSLARVKMLVEKADIGYLGYMLKCANLVADENEFTSQLTSFERLRRFSVKTGDLPAAKKPSLPKITTADSSLVDLEQIGRELKEESSKMVKPLPPKTDAAVPKTDSLTKMELLTDLELASVKSKLLSSKTSLKDSSSKINLVSKSDLMAKTDILSKRPSVLKGKTIKLAKSGKIFKNSIVQNFKTLPGSLKSLKRAKSAPLKLINPGPWNGNRLIQAQNEASLKSIKSLKSGVNRLKLVKSLKSQNRLKLIQAPDERSLKSMKSQPFGENRLIMADPKENPLIQTLDESSLKSLKSEEAKLIKSPKSEENRLKPMKSFYSIPKPVDSSGSRDVVGFDLHKELENLKRDLRLAKNLDKTKEKKKKTVQFLNEILGLKNKPRGHYKKKKIVSRFISSSKLKTIEFVSLIPSDEYARIAVPISFFLFFYFYSLHFIF